MKTKLLILAALVLLTSLTHLAMRDVDGLHQVHIARHDTVTQMHAPGNDPADELPPVRRLPRHTHRPYGGMSEWWLVTPPISYP